MRERKPNIVVIMADQLPAPALPMYGHPVVRAPNLENLARDGVTFDNAYCNYPLCAPSRFSMMTGQLASRIGAYDNGAEFPASVPTYAHYMRKLGYYTCLSGKMHFVGPDQLHGFEERLTSEIYPSDFSWTPDWNNDTEQYVWSHRVAPILEAGLCARTMQLDYDEEVIFQATRKIYDLARRQEDERPFLLVISLTHPHNPYLITPEYWNRYRTSEIDLPTVPAIPPSSLDSHSRRLYDHYELATADITEENIRNVRHAYYGMISYVDDKVGQILDALALTGQSDETCVMFSADHGDMMGERGLWYKMNFYEWSSRIPLVVRGPNIGGSRRVHENVSLVDLLPTLVSFAEDDNVIAGPVDGRSLRPLLEGNGDAGPDNVYGEYLGEATQSPCLMLRHGQYKYIHCDTDPPMLYDLAADPHELNNRAGAPDLREIEAWFTDRIGKIWDTRVLANEIVQSQQRRKLVQEALSTGETTQWEFEPPLNPKPRYIRSGGSVTDLEPRSRLSVKDSGR